MQTKLLSEQQVTGEGGEIIMLSYELLTEELRDAEGKLICELYGARITRRVGECVEEHSIRNITALGNEILRIVDELARHTVFPVHMEDCVQELLL